MNIEQAISFLKDKRYEITQKENIYFLNDIDDSNSQLEAYNEKELIELARQIKGELNEFFSYAIEETKEGFEVNVCDLERNSHFVCFTKNKKIAEHLENHFDNLAMDEEKEIFSEIIKENES